jgi:hypothetical protein
MENNAINLHNLLNPDRNNQLDPQLIGNNDYYNQQPEQEQIAEALLISMLDPGKKSSNENTRSTIDIVLGLFSDIQKNPEKTQSLLESFTVSKRYLECKEECLKEIATSTLEKIIHEHRNTLIAQTIEQIMIHHGQDEQETFLFGFLAKFGEGEQRALKYAFLAKFLNIQGLELSETNRAVELGKLPDFLKALIANEGISLGGYLNNKEKINQFYEHFVAIAGLETKSEVLKSIEILQGQIDLSNRPQEQIKEQQNKIIYEQAEGDSLTLEECVDIIFEHKKPNSDFDENRITAFLQKLIESNKHKENEDLKNALDKFLESNCRYYVCDNSYFLGLDPNSDDYKKILECIVIEKHNLEAQEVPAIRYENNEFIVSGNKNNCLIISSLFLALKSDKFDLKDFLEKNKAVFEKEENESLCLELKDSSKEVLMEFARTKNDRNNLFGKLVDVIRKDTDMLGIRDQNPIDHIRVADLAKILDVKIQYQDTQSHLAPDTNEANFANRVKDDLLLMLSAPHDKNLMDIPFIKNNNIITTTLKRNEKHNLDEKLATRLLLDVAKAASSKITEQDLANGNKNPILDQLITELKEKERKDLSFYLKETVVILYDKSNEHFSIPNNDANYQNKADINPYEVLNLEQILYSIQDEEESHDESSDIEDLSNYELLNKKVIPVFNNKDKIFPDAIAQPKAIKYSLATLMAESNRLRPEAHSDNESGPYSNNVTQQDLWGKLVDLCSYATCNGRW